MESNCAICITRDALERAFIWFWIIAGLFCLEYFIEIAVCALRSSRAKPVLRLEFHGVDWDREDKGPTEIPACTEEQREAYMAKVTEWAAQYRAIEELLGPNDEDVDEYYDSAYGESECP